MRRSLVNLLNRMPIIARSGRTRAVKLDEPYLLGIIVRHHVEVEQLAEEY
jgi:hypothetical protein